MLIPRPPIEEQREIVAHLDTKLAELGRLVAGIETQIATLAAYRKSLIHECVTGQWRVREEDVPGTELAEKTGPLNHGVRHRRRPSDDFR
jgi:hypothetical protein